ncbi:LLM class flavin-dependent oxidoreductase [Actinomycetospora termitidis]|uniref:LLM class flavin-dependent oxidoreductase n=1 Tax=Actinomycetospora termitidis TaxID=3053470 RepID=A0ABT7MHD3_9PSEU|nr:LLM class flavin-dependent oxidoreductase [Actinomycetospora sp. Odt1-22]MDL5160089.1 LLM class flavin-dependent oxidoreductase [Actinomycetospora sp. Odt1-22]
MPVEFLGIAATNDGSEVGARSGPAFDPDYTLRLARAHRDHGWDRVLTAYSSGSPDPAQAATYILDHVEGLQLLVAHRPNLSIPTFAAKTFATMDVIGGGRVTVHVITGGSDHEQAREGDRLPKDDRYGRTREYMQILKQAWTRTEAWDYAGEHYAFEDFVADVRPLQSPRPNLSFGGSSAAAYATGGAEADIYALWGEPLADTAEQIRTVHAAARAAGRTTMPRIQVAFRPILGVTEEAAWEKAYATVARIEERTQGGTVPLTNRHRLQNPENAGSQRLLAVAERGERFDRALWTVTAKATGGGGNSNALVGTPETVAAALVDYWDLGVDILSARGYDLLADAEEFGREVIPLVRAEVARREAEGRPRGVDTLTAA